MLTATWNHFLIQRRMRHWRRRRHLRMRRRHWRRRRRIPANRRGHRTNRIYRIKLVRQYQQILGKAENAGAFRFGTDGVTIILKDFFPEGKELPFEDYRIRLAKVEGIPRREDWTHWEGAGVTVPIQDQHLRDFFKKTRLTVDPLANWDGARKWTLRKGFKRLFRPRPQLSVTDTDTANTTAALWLNNPRGAWIPLMKKGETTASTTSGTRVNHYGLAFSFPEPWPADFEMQIKATIYVEFRQLNMTHMN
ncbi:capsid protein [Finch circovirus]|uniref:Capsid protein n=1 Tax=Finch circovirus TaxID=400122 RepID=Q06J73_9CIRC|nr:capsid protein [Finch circovirus]ABI54258.1 capsid protein [Finch circovirus]